MKKYELQILRYYHDIVTGEFVNVGIVMFNRETSFLECSVTHKYARLSRFFHAEKTASFASQAIKLFETSIKRISNDIKGFFNDEYKSLEDITSKVLPKDNSSLQCSELIRGMSLNFERTFDGLFKRYIKTYEDQHQRESKTDEQAWSHVYKKYFDEYGITSKLSKHHIKTANDKFDFNLAYQNGILHVYNPVSFDLVDHDSIREKVYRWRGKISEIETAKENLQIHMLPLYPQHQDNQEKIFIEKILQSSSSKKNVLIHNERNIISHLKELRDYIVNSENSQE